jgi:excinuclease ABC subunit B
MLNSDMVAEGHLETRPKIEGGKRFVINTEFNPAGDQPAAILELTKGISGGEKNQVLLGATGTGKTFTMAKIIEETQKPAIILAPNKTLAAQLYGEFKGFFSRQRCRIFCKLLRLLSTGSVCSKIRHLY